MLDNPAALRRAAPKGSIAKRSNGLSVHGARLEARTIAFAAYRLSWM